MCTFLYEKHTPAFISRTISDKIDNPTKSASQYRDISDRTIVRFSGIGDISEESVKLFKKFKLEGSENYSISRFSNMP